MNCVNKIDQKYPKMPAKPVPLDQPAKHLFVS